MILISFSQEPFSTNFFGDVYNIFTLLHLQSKVFYTSSVVQYGK